MSQTCTLLEGFGGMLPQENFLKWCNLVRFGLYLDQILTLNFFQKVPFFTYFFLITIFYVKTFTI